MMTTKKQTNTTSEKTATECFLLNIYYPLAHKEETKLVGTVEKLGNEDKQVFHDIHELLHLLGIDHFRSEGSDQ